MPTLERGARSKAIRDYLETHPHAGPKQVVADLRAQGIDVTDGLVSSIKYGPNSKKKMRGRKGSRPKAVRGRPKGRGAGSKSEAIRRYLQRFPDAKPLEITAGLRKEGIRVTRGLASNVKF